MVKNRYHTDVEHGQIVALHKNGLSQCQISKQLGINRSSVQQTIKKSAKEGIFGNQKKSGRPRKTTARDDIAMKRFVAHSPTSSCKKVRANLLRKGTDVSISIVSRRLSKEFGLKSCKPAKKTKLTPIMKKRLAFAKKHLHWTADD